MALLKLAALGTLGYVGYKYYEKNFAPRNAAPAFAGNQPVHFIDQLPTVQIQRLGYGRGLERAGLNAQECRFAAVTGRQHVHSGGRHASLGQDRDGVVEVDVVDRERIGPAPAVLLEQRSRRAGHQRLGLRDRHVAHLQQCAPCAGTHDLGHFVRLVLSNAIVRIGKNDDAGMTARLQDRRERGDPCDLERVGRYVHRHGRARHGARFGRHVPADDRYASLGERFQPGEQRVRVPTDDDQPVRSGCQRVRQHLQAQVRRTARVEYLHAPADDLRRLHHTVHDAENAAVAQILGDDRDVLPLLGARACARPAPGRGRLRRGVDDALGFGQIRVRRGSRRARPRSHGRALSQGPRGDERQHPYPHRKQAPHADPQQHHPGRLAHHRKHTKTMFASNPLNEILVQPSALDGTVSAHFLSVE